MRGAPHDHHRTRSIPTRFTLSFLPAQVRPFSFSLVARFASVRLDTVAIGQRRGQHCASQGEAARLADKDSDATLAGCKDLPSLSVCSGAIGSQVVANMRRLAWSCRHSFHKVRVSGSDRPIAASLAEFPFSPISLPLAFRDHSTCEAMLLGTRSTTNPPVRRARCLILQSFARQSFSKRGHPCQRSSSIWDSPELDSVLQVPTS